MKTLLYRGCVYVVKSSLHPSPGERLEWFRGEAPASHGTYRMRQSSDGTVSLTYQKNGSKKEKTLETYAGKHSVYAKAEACHLAADKHHNSQTKT